MALLPDGEGKEVHLDLNAGLNRSCVCIWEIFIETIHKLIHFRTIQEKF